MDKDNKAIKEEIETEIKAISSIAPILADLSEEKRTNVISYFIKRFNVNLQGVMMAQTKSPMTRQQSFQDIQQDQVSTTQMDSIQSFLREKKPKNNYQVIACLAYYLDKVENTQEFGNDEITNANLRAKKSKFTNITRDMTNAQYQYQFITTAINDKKKKMLTDIGERVVEALPDNQKVIDIVKEARKRILKKSSKVAKQANTKK
ncbi:MAG: hypothetical protein Q7S21_05320 [archaeon]|nr:hypothetical protein [archaeon]